LIKPIAKQMAIAVKHLTIKQWLVVKIKLPAKPMVHAVLQQKVAAVNNFNFI